MATVETAFVVFGTVDSGDIGGMGWYLRKIEERKDVLGKKIIKGLFL